MEHTPRIAEKLLQDIWRTQNFTSKLKTFEGEELTVIDPGELNYENAGPDFINARIKIGNFLFSGDIEIDKDYNNWKSHGHNINAKHNKVILHACLTNLHNQFYVYSKDGRRITSICIKPFIDQSLLGNINPDLNVVNEASFIKCNFYADLIDFETKKKFLAKLGIDRFNRKSQKYLQRLKELAYLKSLSINEPVIKYQMHPNFENKQFQSNDFMDRELWEQLFYEIIFEALGYSKNKNEMIKLSQYANVKFLKKLGKGPETNKLFESALLNISGLVPKDKDEKVNGEFGYINELKNDWNKIVPIYDGETMFESEWQFLKLRPQNFPTLRIAGGSRIVYDILYNNLIGLISKKISEIYNFDVLTKSIRSLFIVKSRGFWKNHFVFKQKSNIEIKYLVGISRADEIMINVVLPFFSLYFEIFNRRELSKKILKIYSNYYQSSENKIVSEVADSLEVSDLLKKSIYAQGVLELFRNFCSKKKCEECEIGKIVFN
ncbi:MAG: hypothetical protein CO129_06310 [Ignavibacteriales bacterium CG_4_9_14_3_um_filter_34_10]|nr:MAG: hypothetical protein CO129_06310 [Ignavibacteriales bacterium CG_4_9_14_3_um_filter_34_10]